MVQDKRKPIGFVPVTAYSRDTEIWVMEATGEIFPTYEQYLTRLDYYHQKRFTCEITGHTNLTFFEALNSETKGSTEVDSTFPDLLREPVLRKVQFSTTSRIDDLVNSLYESFKEDFVPGEQVTVSTKDSDVRVDGIVRDKACFPEVRALDGTIERESITRYFVDVPQIPSRQALVDNKHIWRNRKSFTKHILRSFLKNTISRERWDGAPWIVKDHVAKQFHIDTSVPSHLRQEERTVEKRAYAALKKGQLDEAALRYFAGHTHFLSYKPPPKGQKMIKLAGQQIEQYLYALAGDPNAFSPASGVKPHVNLPFSSLLQETVVSKTTPVKTKPVPVPPPIKYPIEDLELLPKPTFIRKPQLKFLGSRAAFSQTDAESTLHFAEINRDSVGLLLEVWNTLNVHAEPFVLDSFTFDDFVDAMRFASLEIECELFVEVHCAVLKLLVSEQGDVAVKLPEMLDDSENEDEGEAVPEHSTTSTSRPDVGSPMADDDSGTANDMTDTQRFVQVPHRASEMLAENTWVDRLKERDFKNGGWQTIVVGILNQLSGQESEAQICGTILAWLAPVHQSPTRNTALKQYVSLDVNLRIAALARLTMLAVGTKTIRNYMEECNELMTTYRKDKIEYQRDRKPLIEELRALNEQRKLLFPDELSDEIPDEMHRLEGITVEIPMVGTAGLLLNSDEDDHTTEDDQIEEESSRDSRRISGRVNDRKRKREEEEARIEEKKAKAEAAKESKQTMQYKQVLKDIEKKEAQIRDCESEILTLDEDLRESACQRTRMLGRDRFWNRYWWFERNGMPFAGLPTSSTANYQYANGRLWVQGPDDMEVDGFFNLDGVESSKYQMEFGFTLMERRDHEEGPSSLVNAHDWGYYDDCDAVDTLITWLDDRGKRERELRKELQIWRNNLCKYMTHRKDYLSRTTKKLAAKDEPVVGIATRKRTYIDQTASKYGCLAWHNSAAIDKLDQLHSTGLVPKKTVKLVSNKKAKTVLPEKSAPRTRSAWK